MAELNWVFLFSFDLRKWPLPNVVYSAKKVLSLMRALVGRVQSPRGPSPTYAHYMDVLLVGLGRWVRSYPYCVRHLGVGPPPLLHSRLYIIGEGHCGGSSCLSELEPSDTFQGFVFCLVGFLVPPVAASWGVRLGGGRRPVGSPPSSCPSGPRYSPGGGHCQY